MESQTGLKSCQRVSSPPVGVSAIALSTTSINVSWNEPSQLNGILHDYRVKYRLENEPFGTPLITNSRSLKIESLKPFREYQFQVSATTKGGAITGKWSSSETAKTLGAISTPPRRVTATALSSTSIQVSWDEPSSLNGVLHDYKVLYKMTNRSISTQVETKNQQFVIQLLKPFTDYSFKVSATIFGGAIFGEWSPTVTAKTFEGIPTKPQSLKEIEVSSRSLYIRWSKPAEKNGIIRNYTVSYIGQKTYNRTFQHNNNITVVNDPNIQETAANLSNLVPGTMYSIAVAATTGGGQGHFSSKLITKTSLAGPPPPSLQNVGKINGITKLRLGSSWDLNGPISEYQITFLEGVIISCPESNLEEVLRPSKIPLDLQLKPGRKVITGISTKLKTVANYTVCYRAVIYDQDEKYLGKFAHTVIERTTLETLDTKEYESGIEENTLTIPLAHGPGNVKSYHIVIVEANNNSKLKLPDAWRPDELGPHDSTTHVPGKPYVTGILTSFARNFVIGDGKEYVTSTRERRSVNRRKYKNVPLKSGTEYLVFQRAYISQDLYYSSQWIGPLKTKMDENARSDDSKAPLVGIVAGVVIPVIIIIIIIVTIWFLRRRTAGPPTKSRTEMPEETLVPLPKIQKPHDNIAYELENGYEAPQNENKTTSEHIYESLLGRRRTSAASLEYKEISVSVGNDIRHPPILLENFTEHCKNMQKDNHRGIKMEFKDLIKDQQFPTDVAINAVNQPKNRIASIVAYDHSRVHLNLIPGVPHSDYFNANHITGYSARQVYIASQGPFDAVLDDFWRMVWEKKVAAIIMVTNLFEGRKRKCTQYWPDAGATKYGDLIVTMVSSENYVDFVIRCLSISKEGSKEVKIVYQYHYLALPVCAVPEFPTGLINMRFKFRKNFPYNMEEPILVHCSAGIGLTGIFIVIDTMLELAQTEKKIDVFNYLNFIRRQRINLVPEEEQYIFIYNALLEALACGQTEIESHNLKLHIKSLQAKDRNGADGFQQQFQHLMLLTSHIIPAEGSTGLMAANKSKNRAAGIVPKDKYRFILQDSACEGSGNYINAIHIDGYKKRKAYIATQHPLRSTIDDFWNMVQQGKVSTVVLLNRLNDGTETLLCFWPALEKTDKYGKVYVHAKSENKKSYAIERHFLVSLQSSFEDSVDITMLHFQNWPDHSVPKDYSKLLNLISSVEICQQQRNNDQPTVIMCRDGASRTGMFIAISILMERFRTEQLVDVFQTVKTLRAFRPQFVENVAQYKFCYNILQAYMDSFDTYANFTG